jgi:amino acid transporter
MSKEKVSDDGVAGTVDLEGSSSPTNNQEYNLASGHDQLERGLKSRHIQFLALGGAIGTGLFVGSGGILAECGPAPLFMAYLSMMMLVWSIMNNLAEIVTYLPMRGITVPYFVGRFVDPSLAFASGWNYWYAYAMLVGAEASAAGIIIEYWDPPVNIAVWITIVMIVMLLLNIIAVEFFGEAEFWMSLVKALVIVIMILICFIFALGGGPNKRRTGFYFWQNPGAFAEYNGSVNGKAFVIEGDVGRFVGFWASVVQATFAYLGTELVGVAFGETPNPRKNVPRAVRQTLLRIVLFYMGGVIVLGMAVAYNDPVLKTAAANGIKAGGASSPFVIATLGQGLDALPNAVNGLLLVFTISAANSDIYLASRSVWALAKDGQAPHIFHKTNKRGVPLWGVGLSCLFIALGFMNVSKDAGTVFGYFVSLVTVFGALNWIACLVSYIAMTKGMKAQGIPRSVMPYRNPLLPWGAYVALVITIVVIIFNGFAAFIPVFQVDKFITSYIGIPVYLINIFAWKFIKGTKRVRAEEMDLVTGRRDA